jgi:hypothetical protein
MKLALRSSILGFVVTGAIVAACSGTTPIDPVDAGPDAEATPDTSVPEAAADSASPDAQQDAERDALVVDADRPDAERDASEGDAMADASDPGDAMADASDPGDAMASDAMADAGSLPPPLFMPGESGALYEMRAVCAIQHINRAGTADNCCRASAFTATTTCDTMLREEPDGAGSLRVVVEPMQACATLLTGENCTRTGNLPRCDSNGLVCPANGTTGMGGPELVAGTYARRFRRVGAPTETTPVDHYWLSGCPSGPTGTTGLPASACTPPGVSGSYGPTRPILTTLQRTGVGVFTARRSWSDITAPSCLGPSVDAPVTLANTLFANGQGTGGTFRLDKYTCTYTLTKK